MKLLIAVLLSLVCLAARADTTVVILRHGEKPEAGLGQLTCQGLNRALALPEVLLARFGTPVAIHATNPSILKSDRGVSYPYIRPLATIEPTAIRLQMPVDIQYGMRETRSLAQAILAQPGLHLVAWEHHLGAVLARELVKQAGGQVEVPMWRDEDFDSLYVVRVSDAGQASFEIQQQGLNGQPAACPRAEQTDR